MEYSNNIIDNLLQQFKPAMGNDFDKYRNHVYRVFLNCTLLDSNKNNEDKYAVAAVFHDIGIWTDYTIDYLDPSIHQAKIYLEQNGMQKWVDEIVLMIQWHHKVSKYKGDYNEIVENFRKADWIDVSLGLLRFGVDKQKIENNKRLLPNLGFHFFLIKKLMKNFFKHPFNPLPMFRK